MKDNKTIDEYLSDIKKILFGDYLEWLEQFLSKYPNFTDIEWSLNGTLSEEDYENVSILHLLYEIIALCGKKNYSTSNQLYTKSYYVKNNNLIFSIGKIPDERPIIFVKGNHLNPTDKFIIDFKDVISYYQENQKTNTLLHLITNTIHENSDLQPISKNK